MLSIILIITIFSSSLVTISHSFEPRHHPHGTYPTFFSTEQMGTARSVSSIIIISISAIFAIFPSLVYFC
jgi:hypothetical protein